ncbi:fumarylacetoacetate hydrolase [Aspergillus sclerotialis]|uniref:Fumarylacetoacetase n=1 Tax=Aspergillus sclerotialis TaxID=2070753 RepID=A0A3A2ZNZ7_9EURO|nr:fumarylacetoacetate hydrolase [Aspergillus sclerotialis]
MTSPDYSSHFSTKNFPFGIASSSNHTTPQCVTRVSNTVVFLDTLQNAGLFNHIVGLPSGVFASETLNSYAALSRDIHRDVRKTLQDTLADGLDNLPENSTEDIANIQLYLPVSIPTFTDFSCSKHHVQNAGLAILNDPTPPPGFDHFPIGYTGRASSIVVSGTDIVRPVGHFYSTSSQADSSSALAERQVVFGKSQAMDYEAEIGIVIGRGIEQGRMVRVEENVVEDCIFGLVILNDWSARDIQGLEMKPLGPLNGKSFATSISPWIITVDALEPFKVSGPVPETTVAPHLQENGNSHYSIDVKVELQTDDSTKTLVSESQARDLYWSVQQMCAHLASSGCGLQTGEILGTGTVSGPSDSELGCLLEVTKGGKVPFRLSDGRRRMYLENGDVIAMTAVAGEGVGFGECVGRLVG